MSTHNKGFYEELTKIILPLSPNMQLISSSDVMFFNEKRKNCNSVIGISFV